jgi:hypothetical protein
MTITNTRWRLITVVPLVLRLPPDKLFGLLASGNYTRSKNHPAF